MHEASRDFETVRLRIETWLRGDGRARLARARGESDALSARGSAAQSRELLSAQTHDVLGEALERRFAEPEEIKALAAHAANAVRALETARVEDSLYLHAIRPVEGEPEALSFTAMVESLRARPHRASAVAPLFGREATRARGPVLEARYLGDARSAKLDTLASGRVDALDATDVAKDAETFLTATDDLVFVALDYLEHRLRKPVDLLSGLAALGPVALDDAFRTDARGVRIAEIFAPLGLGRTLAQRVRLEPPKATAGLSAELLRLELPRDVRVRPSAHGGLLGELALVEGVGRALCESLSSPAVPYALRHPLEGTASRAFGALFVRIAFDRGRLDRARKLPEDVKEAMRRLAATTSLLTLRVAAAAQLVPSDDPEAARALFHRATRASVSGDVARLAFTSRTLAPRFVAGRAALALFDTLRERFDEDFDRNPRSQDVIRGFCERGAGVAVQTLLDEQGVRFDDVAALRSWFEGR